MGKKIVVDPVTRIEGHLKIEVEIEKGKVKNAWSSGTMARGIELLLQGKDPRDACNGSRQKQSHGRWRCHSRECGTNQPAKPKLLPRPQRHRGT